MWLTRHSGQFAAILMNPTYARKGNYFKIENDYTGTFGLSFRRVVDRPR